MICPLLYSSHSPTIHQPFTNHSPMGLFFRPGLTHSTLKRGNQWFGFPPHFRKTYGKNLISRWFAFFILFLLLIWRFREIGVRPKSSIYRWIFHYKPSSYWGTLHPTRNSQGASMCWSRLRNNAFSSFSASLPQGRVDPIFIFSPLPSGKLTFGYWKWPFIIYLPMKHGDFP